MSALHEIDYAQPEGFRPLSLDLRLPARDGAPVIVFLHGGGFLRGSRRVFTPGIGPAESFDRIVGAGYAIASCEYRLSGEARFPAQLDDVDAALDWVHENADAHGLDTSRVVLWGVSAGATLACLSGLRRPDVHAVVDWFGPTDLFAMAAHETGERPDRTREARWIGGAAERLPAVARRASPVHQVRAGAPPFHIAHGTADDLVPIDQSDRLGAELSAAGVRADLHRVDGAGHFWQGIDPAPRFDAALAFLAEVLATDSEREGTPS